MPTTKKMSPIAIVAGSLMGIMALDEISYLFRSFSLWSLLWLAGYAVAAVFLIMNRRDILGIIGFGINALMYLRALIINLGEMYMISSFLCMVAWGGMCFIALVSLTDYVPQCKSMVKNLWFIPAAVLLLVFIIHPIILINYIYGDMMAYFGLFEMIGEFFRQLDLIDLIEIGAMVCAGMWMAYPDGMAKKPMYTPNGGYAYPNAQYTAPQYNAPQYTAPQQPNPQYAAPQYTAPQQTAPQYAPQNTPAPQQAAPRASLSPDALQQLQAYQTLLQTGAITMEEYEAKRKELTGI